MKLKTLTTEQTQKLINDLDNYWGLCQAVTFNTRHKIEEAFNAHQRDYKWNWKHPFTFRIKTFDRMVYKVSGGQFRDTYYSFMKNKGFDMYLSSWMGDSDPAYSFVDKGHQQLLIDASRIGSWNHKPLAEFHELVEKYAEHPLIPDANDIEMIKVLHQRLTLLENMWSNDAI